MLIDGVQDAQRLCTCNRFAMCRERRGYEAKKAFQTRRSSVTVIDEARRSRGNVSLESSRSVHRLYTL